MKNMIFTCIIFFLMLFILFFASKYIILTCDKLLDVSSKIEENIVNDNWDESYMLSFELLNIYEGHIANLTLFLNHTDFDNIYSEIIKLSQYSKCESKDEALSSIHVVKTLINHVKELESITVGNIF
ncbi:MAG TPA: hypothetical protein DCM59_04660 [Clostridium sp.]|jgi:hypothetical protein|uniref:DUF4363 family protein n=1 Tax=unclassified Clostridium TaxID=2614128 RepID=UPI000EC85287|nr:hypothetical protein [Clostridium sp.]